MISSQLERSDPGPANRLRFILRGAVASLAVALVATLSPAAVVPRAAAAAPCTVEQGQAFIDDGRLDRAVREFGCLIKADPTGVEGYRGRIEAELLLGRYADALRDYTRVTAFVEPVHPDAKLTIYDGYASRLTDDPDDVAALTGASFARWYFFEYVHASPFLNHLLDVSPDAVYGHLFRGSSRLLMGVSRNAGVADLEQALALAPASPDVRFVVADAYTYGLPDPERAFAEASLALDWGLHTPRVHAILAAAYNAFGDLQAAADHIFTHIDLVTTELVGTAALASGEALSLPLAPGRTYEVPLVAAAGETISIVTSSPDIWDSIAVLLDAGGSPVLGSDDDNGYFAAFDWVAPVAGTYRLRVTSFESVSTGELVVSR